MTKLFLIAGVVGLAFGALECRADTTSSESKQESESDRAAPNLDTATFGGKQFWTDEFVYLDWRIQRHVVSNHYRLLDGENVRRAWGTFEQCRAEFERLKQELSLPAMKPQVVLVLHGLVRSRESMSGLCEYLQANSEYSVLNVSYASSREKVADHAAALGRVVNRLEGVREVNFVAHSMGNLVIRHYLGDMNEGLVQRPPNIQLRRMVMLAAPNNGADMALRFGKNVLFQTIWGETGRELAESWSELEKRLACPQCEFGIIAGGKGNDNGFNPLLAGDDDFVVSVAETRLPGARDFSTLPVVHGAIMGNRQVQEQTLRFLECGYFLSEDERRPIPARNSTSSDE